ncbi:hypothetical protein Q765_16775 [Flavobacterium rivuli WB 3.3-2 = DSM 21788]|uniref:Uncharacterized protein n=1 Tax=Flavobacterium rivuli WB 3.3-2 = DSM 21788 TaxID=1121895 RepID=A0A0A2LZD0_9FLAO|nr:hypothetical protein [Flavobacterium rivuli]KGO85394.1 hypothetical protein Q765_16775 [Flavobacterium rivuli WB 3.3-2 = DSM 21788]
MSKEIVFSAYKFNLLPYENKNLSFNFEGEDPDFTLKKDRNKVFSSILLSLSTHKSDKNMFKLVDSEKELYLFKISNKKNAHIVDDNFEKTTIQSNPYVYIVVDNDPKSQFIFISEAAEIFKTVNSTKNILLAVFRRHLQLEILNIEITEVFDKKDFWKLAKDNENKINYINIEVKKPNPFDKPKTMYEGFQNFAGKTNAYKSNILLRAPEKGILKGINPKNKDLVSLVEQSSESGGDIKIKIVNIRKQISTNSSVKKVKINESDLDKNGDKLFNMYMETFRV